jgi:oxygen-independent coproporphyrinogen-3 oxidase
MAEDGLLPAWIWPRAAYIHIPFCAHHCGYCDFAVATGQDTMIDLYLEALELELSGLGTPQSVKTIFLGGGTPTYLQTRQLVKLLQSVGKYLPTAGTIEFSVEANPGTLTAEKLRVLADHGVNRVSLGAQSFHPHLLSVLERDHVPADVPRAVEAIRKTIRSFSIDLIFGVPGQTLADWESDLSRALQLEPDHISTYGLTYEKGTRLWKQRRQGSVRALDEESELAMYILAMDRLEEAGFEQYEISNFARPGRRSLHNQVYWANEAYFGFGMGAARYVNFSRELNTRELSTYIRKLFAGESATFQSETLKPEERARESLAIQMRRSEGITRGRFAEQTGFEVDELVGHVIQQQVGLGLVEDDGSRICLTRSGKCVADSLVEQFL